VPTPTRSLPTRLPALLVALLLLATACGEVAAETVVAVPAPTQAPQPTEEPTAEPTEEAREIADPVRIVIPAIEVDAEVIQTGLLPDGAMAVPDFGLAGAYELGPMPGEPGPAVIAAHVDSRAGPDVFFRLKEMEPGDEIHVHTADGEVITFIAEDKEMTDKDELPTERIWNDTTEPVLRLITCGGDFDRSIRHYTHNWTVYASQA
jgi:LPXTG-site transpeptidase (sortase) family protein